MPKITIKASRWPWQYRTSMALLSDPKTEAVGSKYGWRGTPGMGRFGGGWNWKLGIAISSGDTGGTVMVDLLFGMVSISWRTKKGQEADRKYEEEKAERRRRDAAAAADRNTGQNRPYSDIPF